MPVLDVILDAARETLPGVRSRRPELERMVATRVPGPDFAAALRQSTVAVIAEVKRRSPSAGAINEALDPSALASAYAAGGAAAISVLTNASHFGGSLLDLERVTASVGVPVLRKDFILDEVQLLEARAAGASAVLLIVRALAQADLVSLLGAAEALELGVLVEAHTAEELTRALDAGARVIGVNARDLDDFTIDVARSLDLLSRLPGDVIAVAESGMTSVADVERAAGAGADAVLIGGALASAADPRECCASFAEVARRGR